MKKTINIFLVYSLDDEDHISILRAHLSVFERSQDVQVWYDGKIEAGKDWEAETQSALRNADIVLLIVSADSIANDDCYSKMQEALKLHDEGKVKTVPVVLRACLWQDTALGKYLVLPDHDLAVVDERWESADEPYHRIMKALSPLVARIRKGENPGKLEIPVEHFYGGGQENKVIVKTIQVPRAPFYKRFWFGFLMAIVFLILLIIVIPTDDANNVEPQTTSDTKVDGSLMDAPTTFKDPRDGQEYPLIQVGNRIWMAKNLNYDDGFRSSCCFMEDADNCDKFGRLYTWASALSACPKGFHLASLEEWKNAADNFGGAMDFDSGNGGREAYDALITGGSSGFNAKLGGNREGEGFAFAGRSGHYWTATSDLNNMSFTFEFSSRGQLLWSNDDVNDGNACRCVKD